MKKNKRPKYKHPMSSNDLWMVKAECCKDVPIDAKEFETVRNSALEVYSEHGQVFPYMACNIANGEHISWQGNDFTKAVDRKGGAHRFETMQGLLKASGAVAFIIVNEAWASRTDTWNGRPSNDPNRKEAIVVVAKLNDGTYLAEDWEVSAGKVVGLDSVLKTKDPKEAAEWGRMINILEDKEVVTGYQVVNLIENLVREVIEKDLQKDDKFPSGGTEVWHKDGRKVAIKTVRDLMEFIIETGIWKP